jgi:hypothetical protein
MGDWQKAPLLTKKPPVGGPEAIAMVLDTLAEHPPKLSVRVTIKFPGPA